MKKTALAALLSALILVSACDDKSAELNTKLQQAEQQISALNAQLAKTLENLNQTKQAEAEMIPALNVEIYPFFSKREKIKLEKKAGDDSSYDEVSIYYFFSLPKTGLDWLDQLFVQQLGEAYKEDGEEQAQKMSNHDHFSPDEVKAELEKAYQEDIATLKEGDTIAISASLETRYFGQRNNLVTFSQLSDSYSGGAHELFNTDYLTIDLAKKALITLDKLIPKQNQAKLKDLLWEAYEQRSIDMSRDPTEKVETFTKRSDFDLYDNFYFSPNGVVFSYPVYALGPFSEGEIELELPWHKINSLISPDYQRTKKDGVGLAPEDSYN